MAISEKSLQNLKPITTTERAKELGRKGGIEGGKTMRRKKSMKMAAKAMMELAATDPEVVAKMAACGISDDASNQMAVLVSMLGQALAGDVKAAQFLRDTMGESPVERMHREDYRLRKQMFDYQKEKDAGVIGEIEDLTELEADIYGSGSEEE